VLDLNETVENVHKMLARVVGEDIELKVQLAPGLGKIKGDRGQLEQVLMNLVVNARDAMPTGGQLAIRTSDVELGDDYAGDHLEVTPGPHVMLSVSDTGVGMDRETQARIFEPFFTTKERSKGTGLGLSTVFGLVKQCGGSIWVYSELGAGTTFKIYFPRAEGTVQRPSAPPPREITGGETVLLVEDEEPVRNVASGILTRCGYRVLAAGGAADAIALCRTSAEPIHLLLTDVVMPKMNGGQLAQRIQELRPDIKVLFMSGYTDDVISHHGLLESGMSFVQKPLTPIALAGKVREVLNAR
jgi:CheY-like chemotaxis protein